MIPHPLRRCSTAGAARRAAAPALAATLAVAMLAVAACGTARPAEALLAPGRHLVDLTHTLSPDFPYLPVRDATFAFRIAPIATLEKNGVAANKWELTEHNGTHLDAPGHFAPGGATLEQLLVDDLVAPAAVLDLRERAARDPDALLGPEDVLAWESAHGRIPRGAAVFLLSGWEARAQSQERYLNQDAAGLLHFPGFSPEAVELLVAGRGVRGLGTDTLSIDPGLDRRYLGHRRLFAAGAWALECVAHLAELPAAGAVVIVGASKVRGASGGPARVFALW
jgi:kynurenine formamidase